MSDPASNPGTPAAPVTPIPPSAPSVPPSPVQPANDGILVQRGSQQFGPYAQADFLNYAREGRFLATDYVWKPGAPAWEPLANMVQRLGVALPPPPPNPEDESMKWVIPVGRSPLALAAGYLGLFAVMMFPAPIALIVGILAILDIRKHPEKKGIGRAWFGAIMGAIFTLVLVMVIIGSFLK